MPTLPRVSVAVPAPRRVLFDYLWPEGMSLVPGVRVRVPFGSRSVVGIVVALDVQSAIAPDRLRPVTRVLDETPLFGAGLLRLLRWAADYYCHPIGEVMNAALPRTLREGAALPCGARLWSLTTEGRARLEPPGRGPLAARLWAVLHRQTTVAEEGLTPAGRAWCARWHGQGFVVAHEAPLVIPPEAPAAAPAVLNEAQRHAAAGIEALAKDPRPVLLHGVTGSGKTEVYLAAIRATLGRGLQSLVLVPEIGLTPQFVRRLECLSATIVLLHSGLSDGERARAWTAAYRGEAAIVVGTRSAVFAPLARPGLIVVDEEHDLSYKQHEGFRYHGRDLAVLRAHYERVPVVLGSATPSLESLHNATLGRYRLLSLPGRALAQKMPGIQILDLRRLPLADGISPPLLERLRAVYAGRDQALLFLNRRGFAPVLTCPSCGWIASCIRCDAYFTWHRGSARLRCHHCQSEQPVASRCPMCACETLKPLGAGTERIEQALKRHFPEAIVERIDRDTTSGKGVLAKRLRSAEDQADFLVGTQMLSKGHDFPRVTLVAVLAIDGALNSADFRAPEHAAQLLIQVAGRAGRGQRPGEVWVQTQRPDDPLFAALRTHDYLRFSVSTLREREAAGYPPFGHLTLLKAQSKRPGEALDFVSAARARVDGRVPDIELFDPVPSLMERRAGWHRAQLLVRATSRGSMRRFLMRWMPELEALGSRVRWHLDVDPQVIET